MLLRFSASNHGSILEKQELSLIATSLKDEGSTLLTGEGLSAANKALPSAVIYGANASGKSTVISALGFMKKVVLLSHKEGSPGEGVPRIPFLLNTAALKQPSEFSIDFIVNGVRYHYGFEANDKEFIAEWLFAFPSGRKQILFERSGPNSKEIEFGRSLRGRNRVIADLTRNNSLFLSAAIQNGHDELTLISSFFRNIKINRAIEVEGRTISMNFKNVDLDERTIKFLGHIGTGITKFERVNKEISEKSVSFQKDFYTILSKHFSELEPPEVDASTTIVRLGHKGHDSKDVFFEPDLESSGTRRLLMLVSQVFNAIDTGTLLVVDEFDVSVHTQACEAILEIFSNPEINKKNAQLISTTHDTNLMLSRALRRDQIWFTEKDNNGSTHLFPLSDFKTRRSDNIERGYLQGRFGAIPFAGSTARLFEEAG